MTPVLDQIASQRVLPVIRSTSVEDAVATARACAHAGMRVVELTRSVPDVDRALEQLRDDELTLGVGTIGAAAQVKEAAAAGARFVVSFTRPDGFVDRARQLGLTAIPGALTPSEVAACVADGADAVKIFPARLVTACYLQDLRSVLPSVPLVVTGGVGSSPGELATWLRAGALAVGLGGALGTVAGVGSDEVERRVRAALSQAEQALTGPEATR